MKTLFLPNTAYEFNKTTAYWKYFMYNLLFNVQILCKYIRVFSRNVTIFNQNNLCYNVAVKRNQYKSSQGLLISSLNVYWFMCLLHKYFIYNTTLCSKIYMFQSHKINSYKNDIPTSKWSFLYVSTYIRLCLNYMSRREETRIISREQHATLKTKKFKSVSSICKQVFCL